MYLFHFLPTRVGPAGLVKLISLRSDPIYNPIRLLAVAGRPGANAEPR